MGGIRLPLSELKAEDQLAGKIREQSLKNGWEKDADGVLHHQGLPYVPEVIKMEIISRHSNNPLTGHFGIDKTRELIARKYYWPSLQTDVEAYVKACDVCLASKAIRYKPYGNFQSLPVPTQWGKDLSMDFVTGLLVSTNWKGETYDSILVIVDRLSKMVHYKPVKVTIDASGLAEVIINVIVLHHGLPDSIVSNRSSIFTSKFWSSLCYFLGIKRRLSTAFHPQTDGQTERQNSTIEAYFRAFVNYYQDDWARLHPMAEFAYNNAKNSTTGHTPFELNCGLHPRASYEEDIDPRSKSKAADKLATKLKELTTVCRKNLHHAPELQKQYHDKHAKPRSYTQAKKFGLTANISKPNKIAS